jgi:hypothetical protein
MGNDIEKLPDFGLELMGGTRGFVRHGVLLTSREGCCPHGEQDGQGAPPGRAGYLAQENPPPQLEEWV